MQVQTKNALYILTFTLLLVAGVTAITSSAAAEFTTYQADDRGTGYVDAEPISEDVTEVWSHDTENGVLSSPAVTEDSVFYGELRSGNLWEFSPDRRNLETETNATGWLVSLDRETGDEEWRIPTNGSIGWSSPAVVDDTVYIGTLGGTVYAVDTSDGEIEWEFDAAHQFFASPRIVDDTVYIGGRDFSGHSLSHESYPLYALDAKTGEVEWSFDVREGVFGAAAVDDDSVYVGGQNGTLHRLDPDTGEQLWRFETDDLPEDSDMWRQNSAGAINGGVASGPTVVDDNVYFATYAGDVYGVDAETGEEQWNYRVDAPFVTSPAVHGDTLYYGGYDTNIHALDRHTGERQWRYFADWEIAKSSPLVVGDTVYAGAIDGNFYAVDADSGELEWKYFTGTYVDSSPAYYDDTLYFTSFEAVHAFAEDEDRGELENLEYGERDSDDESEDDASTTEGSQDEETTLESQLMEPVAGIPLQTALVAFFAVLWSVAVGAAALRY